MDDPPIIGRAVFSIIDIFHIRYYPFRNDRAASAAVDSTIWISKVQTTDPQWVFMNTRCYKNYLADWLIVHDMVRPTSLCFFSFTGVSALIFSRETIRNILRTLAMKITDYRFWSRDCIIRSIIMWCELSRCTAAIHCPALLLALTFLRTDIHNYENKRIDAWVWQSMFIKCRGKKWKIFPFCRRFPVNASFAMHSFPLHWRKPSIIDRANFDFRERLRPAMGKWNSHARWVVSVRR